MTKTPSLRPWNIKLQPGRPLILRGPAGCGKTTLAREIAAAHGRFFEVAADRLQPPMLVAPDGFSLGLPTCIVDIDSAENGLNEVKWIRGIVEVGKVVVSPPKECVRLVPSPCFIVCLSDQVPLPDWIDKLGWHVPWISWAGYPAAEVAKKQGAQWMIDGEVHVYPVKRQRRLQGGQELLAVGVPIDQMSRQPSPIKSDELDRGTTPAEEALAKRINDELAGSGTDGKPLGECASITIRESGRGLASLYIWDAEFHDSCRVARWFYGAGAKDVEIRHILNVPSGAVVNGHRPDPSGRGPRPWEVEFRIQPASQGQTDSSTPHIIAAT